MRHHQLLAASGMALALAAAPLSAEAADIVQTLKDSGNYSHLVDALNKAGLASTLEGSGSYTVFAPTDDAFEKLQQKDMANLSQGQGTLAEVLKHHVVEGKELTAKDVLGKETKVSTLSGDELSVDGTGAVVMLVPAGLQVTRVGDEVYVRREVAPIAAPAVTVSTAGGQSGQDQQQMSGQSGSSQASGQPQQASNKSGSNQTGGEAGGKSSQQMAGQTGGGGQGQSGGEQGQPMDQQQGLLRAAMVVEPDIQADNGVIHGINEVLVPQKIEQQLMQQSGQQNQQSGQQNQQSGQQNQQSGQQNQQGSQG